MYKFNINLHATIKEKENLHIYFSLFYLIVFYYCYEYFVVLFFSPFDLYGDSLCFVLIKLKVHKMYKYTKRLHRLFK